VSNLTVNGTFTTAINNSINGKILYLANNSTSSSQIDGGGIILGNVQQSYYKSILYSLANNWWDTDGAGLNTQVLNALNTNITGSANISQSLNVGTAYSGIDYNNAGIQNTYNVNSYSQILNQNLSPGTAASTDFVATADNGDDSDYYIDLGINSSGYNGFDPNNAVGTSSLGNDGYLYVQGNSTVPTQPGGNLTIATTTPNRTINFAVTSTGNTVATTVGTVRTTGWTLSNIGTGSIYTNGYFYANGVSIFAGLNSSVATVQTNLNNYESWANANIGGLYNSIIGANTTIQNLSANIGSYYTWANANVSGLSTSIQTLSANVGAYESFANIWLSNLQANVSSINANIGSYYTYANATYSTQANAGGLYNNIQTLNANVGAYEIWANANIGGLQNQITGANVAWQANAASQQTQINSLLANVNSYYATTLVSTSSYTASAADYYIGVNYAGPVTITLPTPAAGNMKVIKDESGQAAANPITIVGTIDNQTNATIALNNGSVTLIYRSGWRII
jgi:hypothetical protein